MLLRFVVALLLVEAALIVGPALWIAVTVRPLSRSLRQPSRGPALRFGVDTFAFRNDSRIHHRGKPDLYANWCFVMARAVVQFQRFARFEPGAARPTAAECAALVRRVTRRPVWRRPLPPHQRIVIPGFGSLHELTRAEQAAVKAGLHGRLWSLLHWTNWRIVFPQLRTHQPRVAAEVVAELQSGRPVQLLITDFPRIALNHSVLVFDYRASGPDTVDFLVYDPNDPTVPGVVRFDAARRRFRPAPLCGVDVPHFRAFRMYCSPVL
jgi:hypothetical protein